MIMTLPRRAFVLLAMVSLILPLVLVGGGVVWQQVAIEEFARREGHHDLFQTWVGKEQFDYTYDYRGNNRYYETWAIRVPYLTVFGVMVLVVIVTGRALRRAGAGGWQFAFICVYALALLTWFTYWSAITWLQNSGIFI